MWANIHPQWRLLQQHLETKGLVGTRSLRQKSGSLPTGLIGLEMIWKTNFVLTEILLRGVFGVLHRTSYGSYASQPLRVSWWTRNVYWLYAQSKSTMVLLLCNYTLHWPLTISCWRIVRAGDCSLPWELELVSPCFTFYSIGQGRVVFCLIVLFCFVFFLVWFALVSIVPDLSFWFRCLQTKLAQLNDCHSCNDARSIVQKKRFTCYVVVKRY